MKMTFFEKTTWFQSGYFRKSGFSPLFKNTSCPFVFVSRHFWNCIYADTPFLILNSFCKGGSRGRVQGVPTTPSPREMTCSFLIQLSTTGILQKYSKKTLFIGVKVTPFLSGAPPPKKNPGSTPVLVVEIGILPSSRATCLLKTHNITTCRR